MPALVVACSQLNPAFDAAEGDTGGATLTQADGDGDGDPGDGDADTNTGDGDADTSETDTSETDTSETDTSGDGDPSTLPPCPDGVEISIPVAYDTFLDNTGGENAPGCAIDWDYNLNGPGLATNLPCRDLDFGAVPMHWACSGTDGPCSSVWLGRFAVGGWEDQNPHVQAAHFAITAKIINEEAVSVSIHELEAEIAEYGECGQWMAGAGYGTPPENCVTTYAYSARPNLWTVETTQKLGADTTIAFTNTSVVNQGDYQNLPLDVDPILIQGWLTGEISHPGVLLTSTAWLPTEFNLLAQGSESPPQLIVKLCAAAP